MVGRRRTFRYLLQPTFRQRIALESLLARQCELYNAALEDRIGAWKWEQRSVSLFDQQGILTELRSVRPDILANGVVVCRGTLKRLDWAFAAFYRRCKAGQTPGFPRFKAVGRWDSVQWEDGNGWHLDTQQHRLRLRGLGDIKVRQHRPLRGTPKAITVKREGRRWWVSIRCVDVPAGRLPPTGRSVGVDLGVAAVIATSDGMVMTDGCYERQAAAKLAQAQQCLSRKRRGSRRRGRSVARVASAYRKVRNQRRDLAHKLSRSLVNDYDLIVHEDLKITNMTRSARGTVEEPGAKVTQKSGLNRSIYDAGWGLLVSFVAYKAEDAGRDVIAVDPHYTSQTCARCGHVSAANRVDQAKFACVACDHRDNADVNAACNILRAGRAQQASACAESQNDSLPQNIAIGYSLRSRVTVQ